MYSLQQMRKGATVVPFMGGPLCQWKKSPFVDGDGVAYVSAEQFMMAKKALLFGDRRAYAEILAASDPSHMKQKGRMVRNFSQRTWDEAKRAIVLEGNMLKFSQSAFMREYILSFPHNCVFAECNPFDCVWGVGLRIGDRDAFDYEKWRGENLLGFVLTEVRDSLLSK